MKREDIRYMERALELARRRKGLTHPNPTVGCVIVKNGKIVGEGYHYKAGYPHAEVEALKRAGKEAEGATVYVTLEPCSHYGRTPPCSLALIQAKVKKVVIATTDPNPLVAGRGIEMLKKAGIEVTVGVLEKEAKKLNEDFFYWITHKKPFVVLKVAQTLDGFIATKEGKSKWITSEESRKDVHLLRCQSDAILVGIGTILKDNPELTVRYIDCEKKPLRVVLDKELKTPLDAKVCDTTKAPTLIYTASEDGAKIEALTSKGVEVVKAPLKGNFLDLDFILNDLGRREIVQLMVEGGATVFGSFFKEKKFQKLVTYIAPKVFGKGLKPFKGFEEKEPSKVPLVFDEITKVERDIKIVAYEREFYDSF